MTENVVTMVSTKEYKEGWDRIFGGNIWKCPACGGVVDCGGEAYCPKTSKLVQMVKVKT